VTFASWWNPTSWGIFSFFFHHNQQFEVVSTTTNNEILNTSTSTSEDVSSNNISIPTTSTKSSLTKNNDIVKNTHTSSSKETILPIVNSTTTSLIPTKNNSQSQISNNANTPINYTKIDMDSYNDDPMNYIGQNIYVTGVFSTFIGRNGGSDSNNFVIIKNPSLGSNSEVAIEIDDDTAYTSVVNELQHPSETAVYNFLRADGVAVGTQSFVQTNGLGIQTSVSIPVIKSNTISQCSNSSGIGCIFITSVPALTPVTSPTVSTPTSEDNKYSLVSFSSYSANSISYSGDKISLVGMFDLVIPRTDDLNSSNFIIITDPYNLAKPQIAIELDDNAQYSNLINAVRHKSDPILSFLGVNGFAAKTESFTETNGLGLQQVLNIPVIRAINVEQCHQGTMSTTVLTGSSIEDNFKCSNWVLEYTDSSIDINQQGSALITAPQQPVITQNPVNPNVTQFTQTYTTSTATSTDATASFTVTTTPVTPPAPTTQAQTDSATTQ